MPTKVVAYVSKPTPGLAVEQVERLMFEARGLNAINGIRGILSFDRRGFLQAIEGTSDAIDELMARILADPRHGDIRMLIDAPTAGRQFVSFTDILCPSGSVADPSLFKDWARGRLSGDVAAAIGRGYAMLEQM